MEKKEQESALQPQQQVNFAPVVNPTDTVEFLMSPLGQQLKRFELHQRMAQMYSVSEIVPKAFQKKVGDCVIAIEMAERLNAEVLTVMQNLYIVYGNPSFSTKFKIARFNLSGRYTSIEYEWCGKPGEDNWGARAFCYNISDVKQEKKRYGSWVTISMAKSEGWYGKNGSKWQTMPEQMLRYRAASMMIDTIAPDVTLGLPTREEVEDSTAYTTYEEVPAVGSQQMPMIGFGQQQMNGEAAEKVEETREEKEEPQQTQKPVEKEKKASAKGGQQVPSRETLFG